MVWVGGWTILGTLVVVDVPKSRASQDLGGQPAQARSHGRKGAQAFKISTLLSEASRLGKKYGALKRP